MSEEMVLFDKWVHLLEIVIVAGIALVVYTAKRRLNRERNSN